MGPIAQSVEQRTFNPWVDGSSPSGPTEVFEINPSFLCQCKVTRPPHYFKNVSMNEWVTQPDFILLSIPVQNFSLECTEKFFASDLGLPRVLISVCRYLTIKLNSFE